MVEQWTENPRVGSSILSLATTFYLLTVVWPVKLRSDAAVGLFGLLAALPIADEVGEGGSQPAQQFVTLGLGNGERG